MRRGDRERVTVVDPAIIAATVEHDLDGFERSLRTIADRLGSPTNGDGPMRGGVERSTDPR